MSGIGDEVLAAQVRAAISMCCSIASAPIRVSARGKVVTLTGAVQNSEQREWVERITLEIPGVKGVINKLVIGEAEGTSPLEAA